MRFDWADAGIRTYSVYILASWTRVLYIGVTGNLQRRVAEHRSKDASGFSARYRVRRLVYVDQTPDVRAAIQREKELKAWSRQKKITLIEAVNPTWRDLAP
ncbi:MAG: GIY-YIG nuclease family protein [Gemmatimonadales bacterium]